MSYYTKSTLYTSLQANTSYGAANNTVAVPGFKDAGGNPARAGVK